MRGIVTGGLDWEYVAKFAKSASLPGNSTGPTSPWRDNKGSYNGASNNFG